MKRFVSVVTWVGLSSAALILLLLLSGRWPAPDQSLGLSASKAGSVVGETFPKGQPQKIDFDLNDPMLEGLSDREQRDQALDWLLWTVASDQMPESEQLNRALFDVPAVRHAYLRQAAHFEYGPTRSCLLDNGDVIALLPKADANHRADDLAQVADAQRKNLGRTPSVIHTFEYELEGLRSASLTRLESVPAERFYVPASGYVEKTVTSAKDLVDFMQNTDDLVSAKVVSGVVQLGGRKSQTAYRNVRPTEVAAVWQAEAEIQGNLLTQQKKIEAFEADWKRQIDEFNNSWRGRPVTYTNRLAHERAVADFKRREEAAADAFAKKLKAEGKSLRLLNGTGFSLDPSYDYAGLSKALVDFDNTLKSGAFSRQGQPMELERNLRALLPADRVAKIIASLDASEPDLLLKFIDELEIPTPGKRANSAALAIYLKDLLEEYSFQAARYDGPLQGTEVGMVLFYTDLLAKLWALDFKRSTPSNVVASFEPMIRVAVSPAYEAEVFKLSSTRLWFGPEDTGYEVVGGDELLFARNSTRIYAASSHPLRPGKEEAPNAESEAFLGWWNDHYEEVAAYEPEYQRLNEIMKWSLLIGWLNEANRGALLGFLQTINVDRSAWFPDWVKRSPQLRFTQWDQVNFFQRGYLNTKTEAMPMLSSESYSNLSMTQTSHLSGGVSLASKDAFKARVSLPKELPATLRRSGLNYKEFKAAGGADELVTLRGTRYNFEKYAADARASVVGPRFKPSILRISGPEGAKFRGRFGDLATGRFTRAVQKTNAATGVRLETAGGDIGTLGIRRTKNGFRVGWEARELDDGFALARKLSTAPDPVAVLKSDPSLKFAGRDPSTGEWFVQTNGSKRWLKLAPEKEPSPDIATGWSARIADLSPEAKTYQVKWLEADQLPEQLRTGGEWTRGPPPKATVAEPPAFPWENPQAIGRIADDIAIDPIRWKTAQNKDLKRTLAELDDISRRQPRKSAEHIREAIARHGEHPQLILREALAEFDAANLDAAASAINRVRVKSPEGFNDVLAEINARLKTASRKRSARISILAAKPSNGRHQVD